MFDKSLYSVVMLRVLWLVVALDPLEYRHGLRKYYTDVTAIFLSNMAGCFERACKDLRIAQVKNLKKA